MTDFEMSNKSLTTTSLGEESKLVPRSSIKTDLHACTLSVWPPRRKLKESGGWQDTHDSPQISPLVGNFAFAGALYELDEDGGEMEAAHQKRDGAVVLYNDRLEQCFRHNLKAGVLDIRWSPDERSEYLACALSTSELHILHLTTHGTLELYAEVKEEGEGLFLSVDWLSSSSTSTQPNHNIGVSTQMGNFFIYELTDSGLTLLHKAEQAHSLMGESVPAWVVHFDPFSRTRLLSGGDDMRMKMWDSRLSLETPVAMSKDHESGVTALQWHPSNEHIFASGSYDEAVRLWDDRNLRTPLLRVPMGGGLWRLQWAEVDVGCRGKGDAESSKESYIGVACMHAGAGLLRLHLGKSNTDDETCHDTTPVLLDMQRFSDDSESQLNYGMDFLTVPTRSSTSSLSSAPVLVTSSFYDNQIHLW
jgi:diphthine methyl ester acylhydrolase